MAFDCHENKKPLLYADLFKPQKLINRFNPEKEYSSFTMPAFEGSSSSSSNLSSFCDSSSSGFSTPFGSELGSSEGEDGDFMAELTRQMAECMLQEEDDYKQDETIGLNDNPEPKASSPVKKNCTDSVAIRNLKNGSYSSPLPVDEPTPTLQVYEVKNQPPVGKQGPVPRCRRVKGSESAKPKPFQKTEHQYMHQQYRGREWPNPNGYVASGMQAVFLGGSGSRNGSSGTGVFLPRVNNDPTPTKKKSGCSTVLIPTRVLQALELHFSRLSDSSAPPSSSAYPKGKSTTTKGQRKGQLEIQDQRDDEMQLPQEWTY